jgi:hypothetical protein
MRRATRFGFVERPTPQPRVIGFSARLREGVGREHQGGFAYTRIQFPYIPCMTSREEPFTYTLAYPKMYTPGYVKGICDRNKRTYLYKYTHFSLYTGGIRRRVYAKKMAGSA